MEQVEQRTSLRSNFSKKGLLAVPAQTGQGRGNQFWVPFMLGSKHIRNNGPEQNSIAKRLLGRS
jgi:hypothetical protein